MDLSASKRIREIFEEALNLLSSERAAYVNRVCGSNRVLRAEVEKLLSADSQAVDDGFLETPVLEWQITDQQLALKDLNSRALANGKDLNLVQVSAQEGYVLADEQTLRQPVGFKINLRHKSMRSSVLLKPGAVLDFPVAIKR